MLAYIPYMDPMGIYANIGGILMVNVAIYSSTMYPMGYGWMLSGKFNVIIQIDAFHQLPSPILVAEITKSLCVMQPSKPAVFDRSTCVMDPITPEESMVT